MLPSETSSKKLLRRADVPLGDRDDQAEVGADDLVLDRQRLFLEPLDLVEVGGLGHAGSIGIAKLVGLVFQVVHLPEQVRFLLAGQQRDLVQGWPGRAAAPWGPWSCRGALPSAGGGSGARIAATGDGVVEARVGHAFELDARGSAAPASR